MAAPVNLHYGDNSDAQLNSVNQWMRSQPWYQHLLASWGQRPDSVHLSDSQKTQIVRAAQANGIIVDEGKLEVDDSGNFASQGHGLRNALIVAGAAGLALTGLGAAGIGPMSGMFGAADAAAAGAAGAGTAALGPSTAASIAATTAAGAAPAGIAAGAGAGAGAAAAGAGAAAAAGGGASVPAGATTSLIPGISNGTLFNTGANLFGQLFGAHLQSSAASDAAAAQSAAAKYSADLTAKAAADALAFNKGSAENAFQNNEVARQMNYGQYAAREHRLGFLGDEVGLPAREVPSFIPGVDPQFTGPGGAPSSGAPTAPSLPSTFGNLSDPSIWMGLVNDPAKRSAFVKSIAPNLSPDMVDYYSKKILGQPGANATEQAGSAQYWANKIIADPTLTGGAGAAPSQTMQPKGMFDSSLYSTPFNYSTPVASVPGALGAYA